MAINSRKIFFVFYQAIFALIILIVQYYSKKSTYSFEGLPSIAN